MKKVKNILLLLTAIFTLGCSQTIVFEDVQTPTPTPTPKPEPEPEPDFDSSSYIDLSAEGTANCYLVKAAGKYKFKTVKGNSTQSIDAASSATVLWESFGTSSKPNVGDLIASATYKDGYVYFATPDTFKSGNASIAVRYSSGTILWSWHIWLSEEGWNDHVYANNAGTMMDRNLGATSATPGSVSAFGLLYQWGRKDPFLGSSAISSNTLAVSTGSWSSVSTQQTVDYVTANPMIFVCGYYEWCTGDGAEDSNYAKRWAESEKTMYDPCPVGYRVPEGGKNGFWSTALCTSSATSAGTTWDSTNKGRHWTLSDGTTAWYSAVCYRSYDSGALSSVGSFGYYWSASPYPSHTSNGAYRLYFNDGSVNPASVSNRGNGYSVRCVSTTATSEPTPEPTEPANNEIWYTSTDGKVVTPAETGYFNVSITSNTYSNGKGVISFSGPITTVGRDKGEEPFLNCANLKSLVLPNGLKTIGYGAFSLCSGLESVTIPETVTYIKYGAFYDCDKLTAIALPSGLLRIDDNAFFSCDLVESVTIPDSVTLIGRGAFSGEKLRAFYGKYASSDNKLIVFDETVICAALGGLTEYSIPNVVKIIDYCAFSGYKNIKKFTIPNSVVSIGDGSFSYCTSLQDITIPDSVTEIVGGSFFNCTSLTSAILSKNLTKIGDATFMNCSKLKNIYCNAVTPPQCGKDLFEGVTTDFKIYVPASSVSAYKSASGWSTYADAIVADPASEPTEPANNEIWYTSTDGAVVTPNASDVFGATIVSNTYTNSKGIIKFSGDVTQIGADAFSYATTLKSITIPESVTEILGGAFAGCNNLSEFVGKFASEDGRCLIVEGELKSFAPKGISDYQIPDTVTTITSGVFVENEELETVTIPNSVMTIESSAFYMCSQLRAYYGKFASADNSCLIVDGVLKAFAPSGYSIYNIPTDVKIIDDSVFFSCENLTSVTIPNGVTQIKSGAFYNCVKLKKISIPDSVIRVEDNAFAYCESATKLTLGNSVDYIGALAFSSCYGLTEITIPNSVATIEDNAFSYNESVAKITIGSGVNSIGSGAFFACNKVSEIYCQPTTPPTLDDDTIFGKSWSGIIIYAPASALAAYKTARYWSTFSSIMKPDPSTFTSAPYAVGDYYNDGTKEGVVFEVSADGTSGKIVSMMQSTGWLQWSSDETEQKRLIGADSETDGAYNTAKVKAISGWETKYPAFKWCADLGEGWYMPAIEELKVFTLNDAVHDAVNNTLSARDGTKLYDIGESKWYWSSTESDKQYDGYFCAWFVVMYYGVTNNLSKYSNYYVRAVSAF